MGTSTRSVRSTIGLDTVAGGVATAHFIARARHFMGSWIRIRKEIGVCFCFMFLVECTGIIVWSSSFQFSLNFFQPTFCCFFGV